MSPRQVVAVLAVVLLAALDGYDVQAMSFAAPAVGKAWHVTHATLGIVLASGLSGMAGGSIGLTPLADTFGRRPVMLGGLVLMVLGSLASALSGTVWQLAASRAVTGIGIGAMVAITTTLAAEFSSARRRTLAVASTTTFFGLGSVIGGLCAAGILRSHGWPWIFAVAAVAGAILLAFAAVAVPESPAFLAGSARQDVFMRLDAVPRKPSGPAMIDGSVVVRANDRASYKALFTGPTVGVTARFTIIYLLTVTATYYLFSWLPQLVSDAGFAPATASLVTAVSSIVAIPAGLMFGALAARFDPLRLTGLGMIGFGAALAGLGLVPPALLPLTIAASACGFFLQATTAVFYATMTASFPPRARVSGIGFVMGVGRLFSGVGPLAAGALFAAGWGRMGVSAIFALAAATGGVVLLASHRRLRVDAGTGVRNYGRGEGVSDRPAGTGDVVATDPDRQR